MKAFYYHKSDGFFWFRLLGFGICIKDTTKHKLLFSERYGYTGGLKIGKYYIKFLKNVF